MRKRDKNPIYFHMIINQNYIILIYIFFYLCWQSDASAFYFFIFIIFLN